MAEEQSTTSNQSWQNRHLWQITPVQDLLWLGLLVFLVWFGYHLRAIFLPLLIALVLAYLFDPVISAAERRLRIPRPVTILFLNVLLIAALLGLLAGLGPEFVVQFTQLIESVGENLRQLAQRYSVDLSSFDQRIQEWTRRFEDNPARFVVEHVSLLLSGTTQAFSVIGQVIGTTTYVAVTSILIPVYFFFLAWKFGSIVSRMEAFIPYHERERTLAILRAMDRAVGAFFRGRLIIAVLMAIMLAVGWSPLFADVPYWLVLSIASGVLSIIPYAAGLGWLLAMLLKGMGADSLDFWAVVWWPSFVYGLAQFIEGWFLTPWIQGRELNLSAITILIVVFIGGALGGLYGMILCVPIAACAKILLLEVIQPRLQRWVAEH